MRVVRFLVEIYDKDEDNAEALAERVEEKLRRIRTTSILSVSPDSNIVEYSDVDRDYFKYQMTCTCRIQIRQDEVDNL